MKILLPVDGSDYTQRMLSCIASHGEWLAALCSSTSALAGRCWLVGGKGHWQPVAAT